MGQALSGMALTGRDEHDAFYCNRFEFPGADSTQLMIMELESGGEGTYYRRFLTGHRGTGKSTELTRLSLSPALEGKFEYVRISAQSELSLSSTQPFDLLEVMAVRLVEQVDQLGLKLDSDLLRKVQDWFRSVVETTTGTKANELEAGSEAGAGINLLGNILSLGVRLKGMARFSSARTEESVRIRLQRLPELKDLCNNLFHQCNRALQVKAGRQWFFLIEDLDKEGVPESVLDQVFLQNSNLWTDLNLHLICTVPLWLTFGDKGDRLPFQRRTLVDIPVFDAQHVRHEPGRRILRDILSKRVDDSLFDKNARELLIQAAGGNLRDMFDVIKEAALIAMLEKQDRIEEKQAHLAINWLRRQYLDRLGETSPVSEISYEDKAKVLMQIYAGGETRIIQDSVLYRLLRSRVVHEYNRTYWYGLPPLVVDILIQQGRLDPESKGGLELD
jgi:hypothetical protein